MGPRETGVYLSLRMPDKNKKFYFLEKMCYGWNMLDDLARCIVRNLVNEMQAVTPDGQVDHKTRLNALKEARAFLKDLLPRLNKGDRDNFSKVLGDELSKKLREIELQESQLKQLSSHSPV